MGPERNLPVPGAVCRVVVLLAKGVLVMLEWILILLIVAAIAGLLGFSSISGLAMTGAKILIGIVLVLFLLVVLGIVAIA